MNFSGQNRRGVTQEFSPREAHAGCIEVGQKPEPDVKPSFQAHKLSANRRCLWLSKRSRSGVMD